MRLSRLLDVAGLTCTQEREITALTCDSREVVPGALFAALEGAREDGNCFISEAVERGAAAILCRSGADVPIPIIRTEQPRRALALMAAEFYGRPAGRMTMIAVTGTKGKTTVAHMLRGILTAAGCKTGMIGTLGSFVGENRIAPAVNTTPEPVELHRLLRKMEESGCTHVVMEASSQAAKLGRLAGVVFDVGIFLNLSPDHIGPGEHEDFEEYRACKGEILGQCRTVVANAADPNWPLLRGMLGGERQILTFDGAKVQTGPGLNILVDGTYCVPMPGHFNGENAKAAMEAAKVLGIGEEYIKEGLAAVSVPGRCMVYPARRSYSVMIDYAHNAASFRALFSALREQEPTRIIAVFGAGGDRPPMRRREMARAAAEGADFAVITEDNPRTEPVEEICRQISEAMPDLPHTIIPNRAEAIRYALSLAREGDVVALLGKGHEQYIETNGMRRHFSECEVLDAYFKG